MSVRWSSGCAPNDYLPLDGGQPWRCQFHAAEALSVVRIFRRLPDVISNFETDSG